MATLLRWQVRLRDPVCTFGVRNGNLIDSVLVGRIIQFKPFGGKFTSLSSLRIRAAAEKKPKLKQNAVRRSVKGPGVITPEPISAPSLVESSNESKNSDSREPFENSGGALYPSSDRNDNKESRVPAVEVSGSRSVDSWTLPFRAFRRTVVRELASFQLAITELFALACLSALGTIIEQNESPQFYFEAYPEENPLFGFFTWRVISNLQLDHIYSSWYFLGLILLLAASLIVCSSTRQLPMVKVARRWSFLKSPASYKKLPFSDTLEKAKLCDLATLLMADGFEVFSRGSTLYAFRGLAGRYAPIGVHIALLLIMAGATFSSIGGYHGSLMVPQGLNFLVGDALQPVGILSAPSPVFNVQVHIDKFYIDYRPTGEVLQFHSDLSLSNRNGELYKKGISVNDPLRYGGLTIYQTDWAISAVQLRVEGSEPFNLVMAALETGDKKLYGTFFPLSQEGLEKAKGISILARDLQSVVFYDQEGRFVGVRRPGSGRPITIEGINILVDDVIGSTGLELKMDPGVPVVYAGFGALMLTTLISYLSHSQVWALQEGSSVLVGGKSNRAKVEFTAQLNKLLDEVPELVESVPVIASSDQTTT